MEIGLVPVVDQIDAGIGDGWSQAERGWIEFYKARGANLTNGTNGGDGAPGRGTPEERSAIIRKGHANKTQEKRSAGVIKLNEILTREQRRQGGLKCDWLRKLNASLTPEERKSRAKKAWESRTSNHSNKARARILAVQARMTPEERSAATKKANESRTPEQRSAITQKGWIKRRAAKTLG